MLSAFAVAVAVVAIVLWIQFSERTSDRSLVRAVSHRESGEFAASIIELRNALAKDPQNAALRIALGNTYIQLRDYANAERELRLAQRFGAPSSQVLDPLARALYMQNKYDQVLQEIWPVGLTGGAAADVYVARGRAYARTDQPEQAQSAYRQALEIVPQHLNALIESARLTIARNQTADAAQTLSRLETLAPKNLEITALRGDYYLKTGQYAEAADHYQQVIAQLPGHTLTKIALAEAQLRQGRDGDVTKLLDEALVQEPNNFDANYLRAVVAINHHDYTTAQRRAERALSTNADHVGSLVVAGAAAFGRGQLELAELNLSKALAKAPYHDVANRLRSAIRQQRSEAAIAGRTSSASGSSFTQLIDDSAQPAEVASAIDRTVVERQAIESGLAYIDAHPSNAQVAPSTGSPGDDLAQFRHLLEREPSDPALEELAAKLIRASASAEARVLLAQYLISRGQAAEALELVTTELDRPASDRRSLMIGAVAALLANQPDRARQTLLRLVEQVPASAELSYLLAVADGQSGGPEAMRAGLDRTLATNPKFAPALAMRIRLGLAQQRIDDAAGDVESLSTLWPGQPAYLDLAAGLALLRGDSRTAIDLYRAAYEASPTSTRVLRLAYAMHRAGEARASRDLLADWVGRFPDDTAATMALANKYLTAKELVEAAELYAVVLRRQPNHIVALNNIAWISLRLGDRAAALKFARQGLALAPDNLLLGDTLAEIYMANGDYDQALALLLRTLQNQKTKADLAVQPQQSSSTTESAAKQPKQLRQTLETVGGTTDRDISNRLLQPFTP